MRPTAAPRATHGVELSNIHNETRRSRRHAPAGFRTIAELAAAGDVGRSTLYRCAKSGELPTYEWRRRLVVSERDYEEFLAVTPRGAAAGPAEAKERR